MTTAEEPDAVAEFEEHISGMIDCWGGDKEAAYTVLWLVELLVQRGALVVKVAADANRRNDNIVFSSTDADLDGDLYIYDWDRYGADDGQDCMQVQLTVPDEDDKEATE